MRLALLCLCTGVLGAARAQVPAGTFNSRIKFILYTPSYNASYTIGSAAGLLADPGFDRSKPTVLFMHGYNESSESECVGVVSRAFLQRGTENFVALDWSVAVAPPYASAYLNVPAAGAAVGGAVDRLVAAGLNKDTFWLIGHSLGAQLAGYIAQNIDFKLYRITGLDPAGPGYGLPVIPSLTRDDAILVDIIHTDTGLYGIALNDGTIDFWPNGGKREQPGCIPGLSMPQRLCSHQRSWRYFAESVNAETAFPAVRCGSWLAFQSGRCPPDGRKSVYMGYAASAALDAGALSGGTSGTHYLRTSSQAPFGLGSDGELPASAA